MAITQSPWATRSLNTPVAGVAGAVVAQMFEIALPAAALAVGDIIELAVLPANNAPVDAILVCDDLDSGGTATITLDVGIMSGEVGSKDQARTCGAQLFSASAIGKAGGVERASLASAFTIAPTDNHRAIGVKVTAAAVTQVAGAKLRLLLKYTAQ